MTAGSRRHRALAKREMKALARIAQVIVHKYGNRRLRYQCMATERGWWCGACGAAVIDAKKKARCPKCRAMVSEVRRHTHPEDIERLNHWLHRMTEPH